MSPYPNLISDSLLVNETIELLKSGNGSESAVNIVDKVMKIAGPPPELALALVIDLIGADPRLKLNDQFVELVEDAYPNRRLDETDFVVFDLETTGAKAPPGRITEIGAYKVSNRQITDEFQTLVNPETSIPEFITRLTNITDSMVANAPKFSQIVDDFLDFIGESVLVAHNAPFDMRFLNYEVSRAYGNYRVGNPHLCTVKLSRKLVEGIENHKLATVANFYSIDLTNHHRAAADAFATAKIFINFLDKLDEIGVEDLESATKLTRKKGN